ncbi:MAG: hypothetical protein IPN86_06745 [Saprospiraceae bacterium]|nr:hypothetical protein [Saprospiraceae bacterium]
MEVFSCSSIIANFVDSIIAEFKTNNTYSVNQWKDGTKTVLIGTYTQTKSSVGSIYTIKLNQSSPTALTAEGILKLQLIN